VSTTPSNDPTAPPLCLPDDTFRFGRNWQRYVAAYLDPERERIAAESLHDLVGDLADKSFIDIGCGSGLFSLCAYRAGASDVVSLDVDSDAIAATSTLHARADAPASWRILRRSILDPMLSSEVEAADVVYAWGVLHHTGDMYTAIRNAAALVKPGGKLAIAIYNRVTDRFLTSQRWWHVKRAYNHSPRPVQVAMEWAFRATWVLTRLRKRQNPVRLVREKKRSRGMALWTDQVDWLGGFPYEFATANEITDFCERSCGLRLLQLLPVKPIDTGNNEFVFERRRPDR
jgi:2-polyprenyl-3-methyl-5-hydroxy-6-metoxy-1,4-benzoquinol methylase